MFLDETLAQHSSRSRSMLLLIIVLGAIGVIGAIAAHWPVVAIGIVLAMILALVAIVWPETATLAVIFLIYSNTPVVAVRFHDVPFIIGASLPVLLIIPLAYYLIYRRQKLIVNPVMRLLVLFLAVQVFGTLFSERIVDATSELINFIIEGIGLYFLITNVIRTPKMLRWVIWVLLLAGALMGGLSLFQQLTGTFDNNYGGFAQITSRGFGTGVESLQGEIRQPRLAGPISEQNRYAQIMLVLVPLGLFRLWGERSPWLRALAAIATGFIMLGVTLTFSRGAAVGFVLMLVIMTFMRYIKPYQLAIILLGLVLIMQAFPQYGVRLASMEALSGLFEEGGTGAAGTDGSTQGRLGEMAAAALVFSDSPIIGVGPGMFKYHYEDYAKLTGFRVHVGMTREAHNLFLGIAAENGALGLILFLAILFVTLRDLARTRKRWMHSRPELAHMATGFVMAIFVYITTGLFAHMAYIRFFWLMMGLAAAACYAANASVSAQRESRGLIVQGSN